MKGEEGSPARADHFSDGRGPIIRPGKLPFRNGEFGCPKLKLTAFTNCHSAHTTITKPVNILSILKEYPSPTKSEQVQEKIEHRPPYF